MPEFVSGIDPARYTHLTSHTADQCSQRLNALMGQYRVALGVQP